MSIKSALLSLILTALFTDMAFARTNTQVLLGYPLTFEFGTKIDSEIVEHTFVLTNMSPTTVSITSVKASCGCTVAHPSKMVIPPGDTTAIEVTFDLKGRHGNQYKSIAVHTDHLSQPTLRLAMSGSVVVELGIIPRQINFQRIHRNAQVSQTARLESIDPDIRVTGIEGPTNRFAVIVAPNGRELTIRTRPPMETGINRDIFKILTNHPKGRSVGLSVLAVAVGDITVTPREILLRGNGRPRGRRAIMLRSAETDQLVIHGVQTPDDAINVVTNTLPNGAISLTLEGLDPAVLDGQELLIETNVESTPEIRIPFKVIQ